MERAIGFCQHLPRLGWRPLVLTADPRAYEAVSDERVGDIPQSVAVQRAFALDAARHLSFLGRYPRFAALPDRWISWLIGAVPAGWRMVRRHRPLVIWSTYPIATAHLVGYLLSRLTRLPWIADFRDPMVERDERTGTSYPTDARLRASRLWVESLVASRAAGVVFCTDAAAAIFARRYSAYPTERIHVIANGYSEAAFATARGEDGGAAPGRLTLVHSGILYPGHDRDPRAFFRALRALIDAQPWWQKRLRVVLRATGFDAEYRPDLARLRLEDCVELAPPVPYRDALGEMLTADALLVFQGHASNPAIPAKVYEYLRARRPIFALVDALGSTAALLRTEGVGTLAPIDDPEAIGAALAGFLLEIESGHAKVLTQERATRFERGHRAVELAQLLDSFVAPRAHAS
ncbi:glycosyltransferase [Piscinibacter defluvii]|uniref:glycosyltransferase n=1 Tax=Piscinibacter defluvii TaxID=1796922 RepID=UPI0013E3C8D5|nr:glycosyltransferase [Piscinibacter defluvii]